VVLFSRLFSAVYDVARKDTFDSLSMWLQEVQQFSMGGGEQVVKLLVGNKVDQERAVNREVRKRLVVCLRVQSLHLLTRTCPCLTHNSTSRSF